MFKKELSYEEQEKKSQKTIDGFNNPVKEEPLVNKGYVLGGKMTPELEKYSAEKLKRAEEKENEMLNKEYWFDKIMNLFYKKRNEENLKEDNQREI